MVNRRQFWLFFIGFIFLTVGSFSITRKSSDASIHIYSKIVDQGVVISQNGNVGINTSNTTEALTVSGNGLFSGSITANLFSGNGIGVTGVTAVSMNTQGLMGAIFVSSNGNESIGTIAPSTNLEVAGTVSASALVVNGDISYTGGIYDLSDRRLKEHIVPLTNPLEMIKAISGVYYNMISTPSKREVGVIAQDVETVLPEAIHIDGTGIKSVDYTRLVPLLLEAIKAQQQQINELREELNTLRVRQ